MNRIGFSMEGEMGRAEEFKRDYRTDAGYRPMDEMAYRQSRERQGGHGAAGGAVPFTRELAEEWTHNMRNADGTSGPHWTMERTEEIRRKTTHDIPSQKMYPLKHKNYK